MHMAHNFPQVRRKDSIVFPIETGNRLEYVSVPSPSASLDSRQRVDNRLASFELTTDKLTTDVSRVVFFTQHDHPTHLG